jgi:hypothetical protein
MMTNWHCEITIKNSKMSTTLFDKYGIRTLYVNGPDMFFYWPSFHSAEVTSPVAFFLGLKSEISRFYTWTRTFTATAVTIPPNYKITLACWDPLSANQLKL